MLYSKTLYISKEMIAEIHKQKLIQYICVFY